MKTCWICLLRNSAILMLLWLHNVTSQESCKFSSGQKEFSKDIDENTPVGAEIFRLQVFPREKFSLESEEGQPTDVTYFKHDEIGDKDVIVKLFRSIEELVDQVNPKKVLKFKLACVGSNGSEIVHVPVHVTIKDVNDHVPEFENAPYVLDIDELTPVGSTVFRDIRAFDGDQPKTENSRLKYSITSGNVHDTFSLPDPNQGNLVLSRPLDYDEGTREYHLEIQAQDHGIPSLSSLTTLTIKIRDTDDQNPAFTQDLYQVRIREKSTITGHSINERLTIVPKIEAYDKDRAINSSITYSILTGNDKKLFEIDPENGNLFVVQEIDREALEDTSFSLQIQAAQTDNSLRQGLARVDIEVLDINDNLPIFDTKLYNISILENAPNGFRVTQVHAQDADTGDNANFKYRLDDPSSAFSINPSTGWILVKDHNQLDREVSSKLKFKVFADEEVPNVNLDAKISFTIVEVKLLDTNDNNPTFIPAGFYEFNVSELAEPGDIIGSVFAMDPDQGDNGKVFYYLPNDTFSDAASAFGILAENGSVYVLDSYVNNRNKPQTYSLFVAAADRPDHPKERRYSLAFVKINVIDVNNNPPEILGLPYDAMVGENLPPGTLVLQCNAKDADINTVLEYSLVPSNGSDYFHIDKSTGMLTTSRTLDYEETNEFNLVVEVSDGEHVSSTSASIYVIDVNDHVPQFRQSVYAFNVSEEQDFKSPIGIIRAFDGDQGRNGKLQYKFLGSRYNNTFSIDDVGNVSILRRLDREREPKFQLTLAAFDGGTPSLSSTANIEINVMDINDNLPRFRNERLLVEIPEELTPPVFLLNVEAFDPDEGESAEIRYEITSGNENGEFSINETTGAVHTLKALDYELTPVYTLNLTAKNVRPFEGNAKVRHDIVTIMQLLINVVDRHDSVPKFQKKSYDFSISENLRANVVVGSVNATDSSATFKQRIIYWMAPTSSGGNQSSYVTVNRTSGEIVLLKSMNYDPPKNERQINITVFARDDLSISKANASVNVIININDINDNKPVFGKDTYQVLIAEDTPVNTVLPVQLKVSDFDDGLNGKISSYGILTSQDFFKINNASGEISLVQKLDYELEQRYILQVAATDSGLPPQTGSVVVLITIENVNEFPPVFANDSYVFNAVKNFPIGGQIGQVSATDMDGNAIKYNFIGGDVEFFRIDGSTGEIFTTVEINIREEYLLKVVAVDDGLPKPQTSTLTVKIKAHPPNNHAPVFVKPIYDAVVAEKDLSGKPIVKVIAKDDDVIYNNIIYYIMEGNAASIFIINETTGEIVVDPERSQLLDYDTQNIYPLAVQAKDAHEEPRTAITMVIVVLEDTNDHPPVFTKSEYDTTVKENSKRGKCFFKVQSTSGDSVDRVQYSIVNSTGPFVIHSLSGQICTEDVLDREKVDRYDLIVQAFDGKFRSLVKIKVNVTDENDNTPKFDKDKFSVVVPNDARAGTVLLRLHVFDPDEANNGQVTFWATNMYGLYDVNSTTGEVILLHDLNKNETDTLIYETTVYAQDHGIDPRTSKASLIIKVTSDSGYPPVFDQFVYEAVIAERMSPLEVIKVNARSMTSGATKGAIRYEIVKVIGNNVDRNFQLDSINGNLMLVKPLNYDENRFVQVLVEARDVEKETLASEAVIQIKVADVNTHPPKFYPFPEVVRIPLSTQLGDTIYNLQATDDDHQYDNVGNLTFDLMGSESMFGLDVITGNVVVEKRLLPTVMNVSFVVRDTGFPPLETFGQLQIEVYDEKSLRNSYPRFQHSLPLEKEFQGRVPVGTQLIQLQATVDSDKPVLYNISSNNCDDVFAINRESGKLTATKSVTKSICHVLVKAYLKETPQLSTEIVVTIKSKQFQKVCPNFPMKEYRASILENSAVGEVVIKDIQVGRPELYQQLNYQLTSDNSNGHFYLETSKNVATLKIKKRVDREKMLLEYRGLFSLKVVANAVIVNCSDWTILKVRIDDINDNTPTFPESVYQVNVQENSIVGTPVSQISALDLDELDKNRLKYAIVDGNSESYFKIDESSGSIVLGRIPDREIVPSFDLLVTATDSANNTGTTKIHVRIDDVNDQTPRFLNDTIVLVLNEGPESINASFLLETIDEDEGVNRELQFKIIKGNDDGGFRISPRDNKGVLRVIKELDRESLTYGFAVKELKIEVRDSGEPSLSSTATIYVLVDDINDMPPEFSEKIYKEVVYETSPINFVVSTVKAIDKDTPEITNLTYSFAEKSDLPFAIDNETGVVTVIRQLDFAEQNVFNITLMVTDGKFLRTGLLQIHVKEELEPPQGRSASQISRYQFRVIENAAGVVVGHIEQKVSKWKVNRTKEFKILDAVADDAFDIFSNGTIYTKSGLDREKRETYSFVVLQEDRKRPEHKETYNVNVIIDDVNDEAPKFTTSYKGTISENSRTGSKVMIKPKVEAIDKDSGIHSLVSYFLAGRDSHLFNIDKVHGDVFWVGLNASYLDRETKDQYILIIGAMDMDNLTSTTNLTVTVTDVNDNPPKFIHGDRTIDVLETMITGKKIARVTAVDVDEPGKNSEVIYSIVSNSEDFTVNPLTGEILLVRTLQPEMGHRINISAIDGGGLASFIELNVRVMDVNNNVPQFAKNLHKFNIPEGHYSTLPMMLGIIGARDADFGQNAEITYQILSGSITGSDGRLPFGIDAKTGALNITGDLDRETQAAYRFIILAEDGGSPRLNGTTEVAINVFDVNDEAPRFVGSPYHAQVAENKEPGQWVKQVRAVDFDSNSTGNGQITYKLGSGHQNKFYIDSKDGNVWTLATLDYETQDSYNITVLAFDGGEPILNSTAMLFVRVTDTVDIVPDFKKSVFTLEVAENTSPGSVIYQLESGSGDFSYAMEDTDGDATFFVDNRTGEITLLRHLDAEKRSHYRMAVLSKDSSIPPNIDKALVNVLIGTGHGLRMFPKRHYQVTVMENKPSPVVIFDFNATDEIGNKNIEYNILGNNYAGLFAIDRSTGKLVATRSFDREVTMEYDLRISAEKVGNIKKRNRPLEGTLDVSFVPSNEVLLTIKVGDENDNAPVFSTKGRAIVTAAPTEAGFGFEIIRVTATDADDGIFGTIQYEIVQRDGDDSRKFFVDPTNGVIRSVIPLILDGSRTFGFDVRATDMQGSKTGKSSLINVMVHLLPDIKMPVMVLRIDPLTAELSLKKIAHHLSNITGYDVRVCKMTVHTDEDTIDQNTTDMYLYAIEPTDNSIVEVDVLLSGLKNSLDVIQSRLKGLNVLKVHDVTFKQKTDSLTVSEVALLAFGCIIFVSAVLGFVALCRKQRRRGSPNAMTPGSFWEEHHKLYGIKNPLVGRTLGSSFADASIDTQRNSCSCVIHSRPGSAGDGESQSYKDSLSSTSTLDLEKSRRPRQRAPSGGHPLPPPPPERASSPVQMSKNRLENINALHRGINNTEPSKWNRHIISDDIDIDDEDLVIRNTLEHTQ